MAQQQEHKREHGRFTFDVIDLGELAYAHAFDFQRETHAKVLALRDDPQRDPAHIGTLLLVEHNPPVITISKRTTARDNLVAPPELLARHGIEIAETDRGGDITYHGPGQLVAYPIFDLNTMGMNLHAYMRHLEQAVIDTCAHFGLAAHRDASATGVWVHRDGSPGGAKICAMGVRIRRWVTMHGLALNVTTNLDHFATIIPCGLAGRPVTSLARELGENAPAMHEVKAALVHALSEPRRAAAPESPAHRASHSGAHAP